MSNIASSVLYSDDLNLSISHVTRETWYMHANQILENSHCLSTTQGQGQGLLRFCCTFF